MNIVWLDEEAGQDVPSVGGKVANLSRLAGQYRVPPGFCLTTAAFQQWASGGDDEVFPPRLLRQLEEAYAEMGRRVEIDQPSVAVRSSAIDEDGRFASFAGQYETFLNLVGDVAVADAVMRCWQSTRSERVTEYRERYGLDEVPCEMAVLVQQLVRADSSTVIFSANPVTHNRDEVVINASWGLGESIVGGTVSPDTFVIDKKSLSVSE
jgi:pyruvate,water dikinase